MRTTKIDMASSNNEGVDMSSFFGAEDDECPICLEQMPVLTIEGTERRRHPCCGQWTCPDCIVKMIPRGRQESVAKTSEECQASCSAAKKPEQSTACPGKNTVCLFPCHLCRAQIPPSISKDYLSLLLKNAEKGYAWAQYLVGGSYEVGKRVERNYKKAARWFRLAAEQGHPWAQYSFGHYLEQGKGVRKSVLEAKTWYEKSASFGYLYAQKELGRLLLDGVGGVEKDQKEAARLFQLSADQGCDEAQFSLGNCYAAGRGVEKDPDKALHWFTKAAEQGHSSAMNSVAGMLMTISKEKHGSPYITGKCPVPRALKWGRRAAAHGCTVAAENNARMEKFLSSMCANCQKPRIASQLLRCQKCRTMYYCSKGCQVNHWKEGHKKDCCDHRD